MRRTFWIIDAVVVVTFVIIGREDHGFANDAAETVRVATPFLIALGVSILATQAWRDPLRVMVGAQLAAGTVIVGMVLRASVWGDGTAWSFVMVTTAFLLAGMVGWRLIGTGARRLRSRRDAAQAPDPISR